MPNTHVVVREGEVIAAGSLDHCQRWKLSEGGDVLTWQEWLDAYRPAEDQRMAASV